MKKRMMAMLMAAMMIIAALPLTAFAEEAAAEMPDQEVLEIEEVVEEAVEADAETPAAAEAPEASGEETAEALLFTGTPNYLYLKNIGTGSVSITIKSYGLGDGVDIYAVPALKYSTDKSVWNDVTIGAGKKEPVAIVIPQGSTVYFKGDFTPADGFSISKYIQFVVAGTDAALKLGGDITTLLDGVGGIDDLGNLPFTSYTGEYAFFRLFKRMKALTDISDLKLPSTKLNDYCYNQMFSGTGIREIPEGLLPAASLAASCYKEMFSQCTTLETIPGNLLPATDLSEETGECYNGMFAECTALEKIPEGLLPATKLCEACYENMFSGCTALKEIPGDLLPATDLSAAEGSCYANMFSGCTALEEIPEGLLPAAALCEGCYFQMFYGSGITGIPEGLLPAASLAAFCYQEMFNSCAALKSIPEGLLPATELSEACYLGMFAGCAGLTAVPAKLLPAEELAVGCYNSMFTYCTSLKETPDLPAENLVRQCYACMYEGCEKLESVRAAFEKWGSSKEEDPDYSATDSFLPSFLADGVTLVFRCSRNLSPDDENIRQLGNQIQMWAGIHTVTVLPNEYGTLEPDRFLYYEDGDTVSLLPVPAEGIRITGVIYKDYRGEHNDAVLLGGRYLFTMPWDDVTVWVTGEKRPDPAPSSGDSRPLFTGTWNNPVSNGKWSQDANGVWHYTSSQQFCGTWGYIENPFAKAGQNKADWFWFDSRGNMLTGWQLINGKWYYLNPSADGTLGACLIGPGKTPDGWEIDATGAWTGR